MKKIISFCVVMLMCYGLSAQEFKLPSTLKLDSVQECRYRDVNELITKDDKVVLVLFNPGCGHCLDFIDSTKAHYDELEGYKMVFVYGDDPSLDIIFSTLHQNMNLAAYDNLIFGKAGEKFFENFRISFLPSLFQYDSKSKHKFIKEIKFEDGVYSNFLNQLKS